MKAVKGRPVKVIGLVTILICLLISVAQADLVALWRFEEGDGNDVNDSSGYGNHGIMIADTEAGDPPTSLTDTTVPDRITGVYGEALQFCNGTDNYNSVWIPKSDSLKILGENWTFAMWIRQDSRDTTPGGGYGYPRVISCPNYEVELGAPGSYDYDYFWPYDNGDMQTDMDDSFLSGNGPISGNLGDWYHMAITWDGQYLRKYFNGTLVDTKDLSGGALINLWDTSGWTDSSLKLACQVWPNKDWLIGALDDVAIFNETLNAGQIADIRDGDFSGPWKKLAYEDDITTFLQDSTFIALKQSVILNTGEKRAGDSDGVGIPSFNWKVGETFDDPNYWGLVNASDLDGDSNSIEYAAYITVDSNIVQPKVGEFAEHKRIRKDTEYDFKVRFAGEDAVGNIVGVKIYAAEVSNPNNVTLLADLNQTIGANGTWYEKSAVFTADEVNYPDTNQTFMAECYVLEGTGNPRGTAFGWFDYVRVDVNAVFTCDAYSYYKNLNVWGDNNEPNKLPYDFVQDCRMDLQDYSAFAENWFSGNNPEPSVEADELLTNPDFYEDLDKVPNYGDFDANAPTDWSFSPATGGDSQKAGIWDRNKDGLVALGAYQPAGGSIVTYIDKDTTLQQTTSSNMQLGQTYYLTAMVAGDATIAMPYLSLVQATLEYDDSGPVQVAEANFVLPYQNPTWRLIAAEYTADSSAAGKPLTVTLDLIENPLAADPCVPDVNGYALIGNVSVTTSKPDVWPRENLLNNGDFEDINGLPYGIPGNHDGWLELYAYNGFGGWVEDTLPGWDTTTVDNPSAIYGLQCMMWAPGPQPVHGRIAAYFDGEIAQKVTAETIQNTTYYLDFVGCINSGGWAEGWNGPWPDEDPNIVVDVYWTEGDDLDDTHGLIASLKVPITGALIGGGDYEIPFSSWIMPETSFTPGPEALGNSFYVVMYTEGLYDMPTTTVEEIYLSKEQRVAVGPYTCYELHDKNYTLVEEDLNGDCDVNLEDLDLFVGEWMNSIPLN